MYIHFHNNKKNTENKVIQIEKNNVEYNWSL